VQKNFPMLKEGCSDWDRVLDGSNFSNSVITSLSAHTNAEGARVPNKSSACRCIRISYHLRNSPSFRMNFLHATISSIEKKRKRFYTTSLLYTSSHLYVGCFKLPNAEGIYPSILLMPAHYHRNTNRQDLEHFKIDCLIYNCLSVLNQYLFDVSKRWRKHITVLISSFMC
jgi:hypothetical protein